jgi:hypothetical protein
MVLRPLQTTSRSSVLKLEGRAPTWASWQAVSPAKQGDLADPALAKIVEGPYVANQTDTAFTLVWTTDRPVPGQVSVTGPDGASRHFGDERGAGGVSHVHYVTVSDLVPETDYQVEIVSREIVHLEVRTGPTLGIPVTIQRWGELSGASGDDVVLVSVPSGEGDEGSYLASPVEGGYWSVNLGNMRTRDLKAYFGSDPEVRLETRLLSGAAIPRENPEQPREEALRQWRQ